MKKSDFYTSHIEFLEWIVWYGNFLKRLIEAKRIIRTKFEKLELMEALVLRVSVRWEILIIQNIITSLNKDSTIYSSVLGLRLRKHLSRDEIKAILIGHRYIDFRNVEEVKSFRKKYLSPAYNPFKVISKSDARKINEFLIMRNLLAHYSDFARRTYNQFMKNKYKYQHIPEPGSFLLAITPSGEYRWSQYLRTFGDVSDVMLKSVT